MPIALDHQMVGDLCLDIRPLLVAMKYHGGVRGNLWWFSLESRAEAEY